MFGVAKFIHRYLKVRNTYFTTGPNKFNQFKSVRTVKLNITNERNNESQNYAIL